METDIDLNPALTYSSAGNCGGDQAQTVELPYERTTIDQGQNWNLTLQNPQTAPLALAVNADTAATLSALSVTAFDSGTSILTLPEAVSGTEGEVSLTGIACDKEIFITGTVDAPLTPRTYSGAGANCGNTQVVSFPAEHTTWSLSLENSGSVPLRLTLDTTGAGRYTPTGFVNDDGSFVALTKVLTINAGSTVAFPGIRCTEALAITGGVLPSEVEFYPIVLSAGSNCGGTESLALNPPATWQMRLVHAAQTADYTLLLGDANQTFSIGDIYAALPRTTRSGDTVTYSSDPLIGLPIVAGETVTFTLYCSADFTITGNLAPFQLGTYLASDLRDCNPSGSTAGNTHTLYLYPPTWMVELINPTAATFGVDFAPGPIANFTEGDRYPNRAAANPSMDGGGNRTNPQRVDVSRVSATRLSFAPGGRFTAELSCNVSLEITGDTLVTSQRIDHKPSNCRAAATGMVQLLLEPRTWTIELTNTAGSPLSNVQFSPALDSGHYATLPPELRGAIVLAQGSQNTFSDFGNNATFKATLLCSVPALTLLEGVGELTEGSGLPAVITQPDTCAGGTKTAELTDPDIFPTGEFWKRVSASAGWGGRLFFTPLSYDSKIWVINGRGTNGTGAEDDVWSTPAAPGDAVGSTWTQVQTQVPWHEGVLGRHNYGAVVHPDSGTDKMWFMGGDEDSTGFRRDVWKSKLGDTNNVNGYDWDQVDANPVDTIVEGVNISRDAEDAPWARRYGHVVLSFPDPNDSDTKKMWLLGGSGNGTPGDGAEVWKSANGEDWVQVDADGNSDGGNMRAPWAVGSGDQQSLVFHAAVVHTDPADGKPKMWIFGGHNTFASISQKVWKSADGKNWDEVTDGNITTAVRRESTQGKYQEVLSLGGRLWLLNRHGTGGDIVNTVWTSLDGATWTRQGGENGVAPWHVGVGRRGFGAVVHDGHVYVMGGTRNQITMHRDFLNDVWVTCFPGETGCTNTPAP